jgi:hypothetical protein
VTETGSTAALTGESFCIAAKFARIEPPRPIATFANPKEIKD